jgi:TolB-like protein
VNELWQRLKQRKLVQWAIAYVAFAFALLQGLDVVAQRFNWPGALERHLILALAIGFFVVLILAWYHGERGAQHIGGAELLILALLLAIGGALIWRMAPETRVPQLGPAAAGAPKIPLASRRAATSTVAIDAAPIPTKSIAVLPFENLSGDKDNDYFAAGMQDLILTKLADIGGLKVIARTSTAKYASHPEDLKTVGRQLGVASILEGSVQKQGRQVLINVQLIDVASDSHLWAQDYTRTLDNVFGVEGEVAEKIAAALDAKLSSTEAAHLTAVPTRNEAAYDLFLRAEYQRNKATQSGYSGFWSAAIPLYQQAIEKDSGFALAYARLSYVESGLARAGGSGRDVAQLNAQAHADAEQALKLAPGLAAAQLALGYNAYWGRLDYDTALKAFSAALAIRPNDPEALEGQGLVQRRTGRFGAAIASFEQAFAQNPRDPVLAEDMSSTFMSAGRYPDAERWAQRALTLDPGYIVAMSDYAHSILFGSGDIARALSVVTGTSNRVQLGVREPLLFLQRQYPQALRLLDSVKPNTSDKLLLYVEVRKPQREAELYRLMGQPERARPLYAQVLPRLRALLKGQEDTTLAEVWSRIGEAELGLDHVAEGLDALKRSQAIGSGSRDRLEALRLMQMNARLYAQAKRPELAVPLIAKALATPGIGGFDSPVMLWLDPMWDPIRHDARFQALLKQYAQYRPAVIPVAAPSNAH